MRLLFPSLIITALLGLSAPALSQSQTTDIRPNAQRVIGEELRTSFTGKTHAGAYNFTPEGEPTRFYEERHNADGSVAYAEEGGRYPGVWLTIKDTICYIYENGNMPGGCFRVYKVANCYYFYSDQIIEREDELDRDYWTARSTLKGQAPKCDAAIS